VDWRRSFTSPADGRCLVAAFLPVSIAVAGPVWIGAEEPVSIRVEALGVPAERAVPLVVDGVVGLAAGLGDIEAEADGSVAALGGTAAAAALVAVVVAGQAVSPAG
jgi:hypothetical protein